MTDGERVVELLDLAETAWGIIANANGGNWDTASNEWKNAAKRWRDRYHLQLQWDKRAENSIESPPDPESLTNLNSSGDSDG